jgi:prevent-host-death family protein
VEEDDEGDLTMRRSRRLRRWTMTEARRHFDELMKAAARSPQLITRYGKPSRVVMSAKAYDKLVAAAKFAV